MNIKQIEYFVTLSEELNFTKASQRLFVTQQSLSEAINKLESEYGVKLFERTRPLQLSSAGIAALPLARKALEYYQKLDETLSSFNAEETLTFGATRTRNRFITPEILPQFKKQYPNVGIKMVTNHQASLEQMVLNGHLDLMMGFDGFQSSKMASVEIATERTFLLVSSALLKKTEQRDCEKKIKEWQQGTSVSEFKDYPFLFRSKGCNSRKMADGLFLDCDLSPNIVYEDDDNDILFNLCLSGMGAMFLPSFLILCGSKNDYIRDGQIYCFPLESERTFRKILIGYSAGRKLREFEKTFIEDFLALHRKYNLLETPF